MSEFHQAQTQAATKPTFTPIASGMLRRRCACGQHTSAGGECELCRHKRVEASLADGRLQRAAINPPPVHEVPPIVHEVLRSPGQPLDAETRALMEPRFRHDFSGVRVHTDVKASNSARAVHALAYTVGQNIVFRSEQFTPNTSDGRRLIAHELTHVIQQNGSMAPQNLAIGSPRDRCEQEADAAAQRMMSMQLGARNSVSLDGPFSHPNRTGMSLHPSPLVIQRTVDPIEFIVKGVFIHMVYDDGEVTDDQIRQLLHTLDLLPARHLPRIPTITIGNRPLRGGGGSAHSGMRGGPYIRLNQAVFSRSWNRGLFNETLLHEVGHVVDWAFGCMVRMRTENRAGYAALLADPHTGHTEGPGEHYADAYADYYLGRIMSEERRNALLTSSAFVE